MQERENPELLRQYLLGDLDDQKREQIEERLLGDEELQVRLSEAEDDLIDEYVLHSLPEREDRLFKQNFFLSPQRQQKLHLSQGLVKYIETNAVINPESHEIASSPPRKLSYFLQMKWPIVALSTAVFLFVIGYGGWKVYLNRQLEHRLSERAKVEQELARLNTGQLREPAAAIASVTLRPLLRDVREVSQGVITEGTAILRLRLKLDEDKFPAYRAGIETDEGVEMYAINGLKPEPGDKNTGITLNLPSRLLQSGNYQIHLSGVVAEQQLVDLGIYPFQVVNNKTR